MMQPHRAPLSDSRSRLRRRGREAFTLVELTVSLVAGLVIALAVASLSREATASFNEEIRISAAEAALRGAADRLRADLQRASFMSTPNIQADKKIGPGIPGVADVPTVPVGIAQLQGIRLMMDTNQNRANTNGLALNILAQNSVIPASIDITGNMTTVDQFPIDGGCVSPPTIPGLPTGCGQITLSKTSDSYYRLLNANDAGVVDPNADQELRAIFQPVASTNNVNQFLVRWFDSLHRSQYLLTCPNVAQVAGISGGVPYVAVAACPTNGPQWGGAGNGVSSYINPVHTVRWEIVGPASTGTTIPTYERNALDNQAMATGVDPNKYDLVRSFVDATGAVIPETTEVIAEYAVDLDFAFSVETAPIVTTAQGDITGASPAIVTYDFGDLNNGAVAAPVLPNVSGPAKPDPQRIRSVRFRIATRAALADRTATIPATGPGTGTGTFLYRYCTNPNGCAGNALQQWARVRTVVSEVALVNQQGVFF